MRIALFYHSLVSDWNHGNAHFLRGVASDLIARGHRVSIYEPAGGWSLGCLLAERGQWVLTEFARVFPGLTSTFYRPESLDPDELLADVDLAIVHEWNDPEVVARIGRWRQRGRGLALFHDTHHRSVTDPAAMAALDLAGYDGVLAYGEAVREQYVRHGWSRRVWVWHEAADVRIFHPRTPPDTRGDLVWIGNWGDDERAAELDEFLIDPIATLGLDAEVFGVRYPADAIARLARAGTRYGGWVANYEVPEVFARFRATVHVPRRAYVTQLPGVPTIRPFEALACGIPLVSSPWPDVEGLFTPGADFLVARDGQEMTRQLRALLHDPALADALATHGRRTILARHTCAHRVDALLAIVDGLCGSRCHHAGVSPAGHA